MNKGSKLNLRQQAFVVEYLKNGGNATQAALAAGYSPKTAYSQGHDLLKKPEIVEIIRRRSRDLEMEAEAIRKRYEQIATQDIRKALSWGPDGVKIVPSADLDEDTAMAVAGVKQRTGKDGSVTVEIEFHDPMAALAALAKFAGMDKVQPPDPTNIALTQNNLNVTLAAMTTEQLEAISDVLNKPELASLKPLLLPLLSEQASKAVPAA
jgi:phage terminase small subunit